MNLSLGNYQKRKRILKVDILLFEKKVQFILNIFSLKFVVKEEKSNTKLPKMINMKEYLKKSKNLQQRLINLRQTSKTT